MLAGSPHLAFSPSRVICPLALDLSRGLTNQERGDKRHCQKNNTTLSTNLLQCASIPLPLTHTGPPTVNPSDRAFATTLPNTVVAAQKEETKSSRAAGQPGIEPGSCRGRERRRGHMLPLHHRPFHKRLLASSLCAVGPMAQDYIGNE